MAQLLNAEKLHADQKLKAKFRDPKPRRKAQTTTTGKDGMAVKKSKAAVEVDDPAESTDPEDNNFSDGGSSEFGLDEEDESDDGGDVDNDKVHLLYYYDSYTCN